MPERGQREANRRLDPIGDPETAEHGLERRSIALDGGDDHGDLLGPGAVADRAEQLVSDQLECPAPSGAGEEPDRRSDRLLLGARLEQRPLEVGEGRGGELRRTWRKLLDSPGGERCEVAGRARQRGKGGPARLVGERDADLGAAGQRLEQRPLGGSQVFEAVREHGLAVPGGEIGAKPLARIPAQQVSIPEPDAVELRAVGGEEDGQVAVEVGRVEEPALELGERREERIGEARETNRGGELGTAPAGAGHGAAGDQRALRTARDGLCAGVAAGNPLEQVVERPDRAAEQAARPFEQVALDAGDVRPVRHDQKRLVVEAGQIALEQERDLARVCGPCNQAECHAAIVVLRPDGELPRAVIVCRCVRDSALAQRQGSGETALPPTLRVALSSRRTWAGGRDERPGDLACPRRRSRRGRRPSSPGVRR